MRLMRTAGERLICAAGRVGGEDGAALAHAGRDMVLDAEVMPPRWPLAELISLVSKANLSQERQLVQLLDTLLTLARATLEDEEGF